MMDTSNVIVQGGNDMAKFLEIPGVLINIDNITHIDIETDKAPGEEPRRVKKIVIHFVNDKTTLVEDEAEAVLKRIRKFIEA